MTTELHHYVLIDGALNPNALPLLYAPNMAGTVVPILAGTPHAPLSASGPLLASVGPDSQIAERWQSGQVPFRHAWWLSSAHAIDELAVLWRRRLLMSAPSNRRVWLRFADARVIARGFELHALPSGFWRGTTTFQLPGQAMCSPIDTDANEALDEQVDTLFRLDERQLNALAAVPSFQENA
ncbi:protein of unknown function [Modicisalibacter muralis]|uniref:DUF4123 domain-containing protein n=1 Tax=Modicisalibacter muralis TaxID=119000 RepID=A0A1G9HZX4_9GAMM|nr:DUF4123 domain-containing protein [Halomonas muralis]SDL18395.1 protein of unknown function [Halomonas muralis]